MEKTLTVKDVASILHYTEETVRDKANNGLIKGNKNTGSWLFLESDINNFMGIDNKSNSSNINMLTDNEDEILRDMCRTYSNSFRGDIKVIIKGSLWEDRPLEDYKTFMFKQLTDYINELNEKYHNPVMIFMLVNKYTQENINSSKI